MGRKKYQHKKKTNLSASLSPKIIVVTQVNNDPPIPSDGSHKTLGQWIWSWPFIAVVIALILGGGISAMTSAWVYTSDVFFIMGFTILLCKFLTWDLPKEHKQRRIIVAGAILLLTMGSLFGNHYLNHEHLDERSIRPYFMLDDISIKEAPSEIKSIGPNYIIEIKLHNIGKHIATNKQERSIFIDQNFNQLASTDSLATNDIPPNSNDVSNYGISFAPKVPPRYFIYAIKYYDKEISTPKTCYQIWYFKQFEGTDKNPPMVFIPASMPERENILIHLKQQLKDYAIPP